MPDYYVRFILDFKHAELEAKVRTADEIGSSFLITFKKWRKYAYHMGQLWPYHIPVKSGCHQHKK